MLAYFFRLDGTQGYSHSATHDLSPHLSDRRCSVPRNSESSLISHETLKLSDSSTPIPSVQTRRSEYDDIDWKEISDDVNSALAHLESLLCCSQFQPSSATPELSAKKSEIPDASVFYLDYSLSLGDTTAVNPYLMSYQLSTPSLMNFQDLGIVSESYVLPGQAPVPIAPPHIGNSLQGLELLSDSAVLSNPALLGTGLAPPELSTPLTLNNDRPLQTSTLQNLPSPLKSYGDDTVTEKKLMDKVSEKVEEVGVVPCSANPTPRIRKRRIAYPLTPSRTLRSHTRTKSPLKPVLSGGVAKKPHGNLRPNVSYARIVSQRNPAKENANAINI